MVGILYNLNLDPLEGIEGASSTIICGLKDLVLTGDVFDAELGYYCLDDLLKVVSRQCQDCRACT